MSSAIKGIVSGLVATLVLSAVMLAKVQLHFVSDNTTINLLSKLAGGNIAGWLDHFIIGTLIWGLAFGGFDAITPEKMPYWMKGMAFSVLAWLVMMLFFMPYVGFGLFDDKNGVVQPTVLLLQHLIYGLVLGTTFGLLTQWVPVKEPQRT